MTGGERASPADGRTLTTPRLRLVAATPALIDAELAGPDALGSTLAAAVPDDWPPEHHDPELLVFMRDAIQQPGAAGWWLRYLVLTAARPPTLVGTAGYQGPPVDRAVEIGYSVVPSWRRHGIATEACRALVDTAWQRGVDVVVAHTLPHLHPSIGVLRKLGFEPSETSRPGVRAFALRRAR